ncbi:MAG: hypothetical protein KME27_29680 [Lyngbya sp. HA4199-MV5]|jgi:hypothetical protein|nr:hypothetical protein [Lyngbya sp. HA4199-MV5]
MPLIDAALLAANEADAIEQIAIQQSFQRESLVLKSTDSCASVDILTRFNVNL